MFTADGYEGIGVAEHLSSNQALRDFEKKAERGAPCSDLAPSVRSGGRPKRRGPELGWHTTRSTPSCISGSSMRNRAEGAVALDPNTVQQAADEWKRRNVGPRHACRGRRFSCEAEREATTDRSAASMLGKSINLYDEDEA